MITYVETTTPLAASAASTPTPRDVGPYPGAPGYPGLTVVANTDAAGGTVLVEHADALAGPWLTLTSRPLDADTTTAVIFSVPLVRRYARVSVRNGPTPQTRLDVRAAVRVTEMG